MNWDSKTKTWRDLQSVEVKDRAKIARFLRYDKGLSIN